MQSSTCLPLFSISMVNEDTCSQGQVMKGFDKYIALVALDLSMIFMNCTPRRHSQLPCVNSFSSLLKNERKNFSHIPSHTCNLDGKEVFNYRKSFYLHWIKYLIYFHSLFSIRNFVPVYSITWLLSSYKVFCITRIQEILQNNRGQLRVNMKWQ